METISFSHNWNNKLQCHYYTTLRLNTPKYRVGQRFEIKLKGYKIHTAKIEEIRILGIDQINEYIAALDTGYNSEACKTMLKKMYPDKNLSTEPLALILLRNEDYYMSLNKIISGAVNEAKKSDLTEIQNP